MFGLLVDRYQHAFLRKACYILHSNDLAEDAVQDTFLKIYKNGPKFEEKEGASFSSWAYRILTNTCYTYLAKKQVQLGDVDEFGSTDNSIGNEEFSLVHSTLARLPTKFSRLLSLYFLEDRSYQEIAEIEQVSLSAVKSGLHRAKKQFKEVAIKII